MDKYEAKEMDDLDESLWKAQAGLRRARKERDELRTQLTAANATIEKFKNPPIEAIMAGLQQIIADITGPHMGPSAERAYKKMIDTILNEGE